MVVSTFNLFEPQVDRLLQLAATLILLKRKVLDYLVDRRQWVGCSRRSDLKRIKVAC
jgi:hypothetical protein